MRRYKIVVFLILGGIIFLYHSQLLQAILSFTFQGKIAIVPIGYVSKRDISLVKDQIEKFYGFQVRIANRINIPTSAYYKPRNRFIADNLLEDLKVWSQLGTIK